MIGPVSAISFRHMDQGAVEDHILNLEQDNICGLPDRNLATLNVLKNGLSDYQFNRLGNFLQTAMRAERETADIELIGMALIHGVGDAPIPENHYQVTTAISRPYVRAELNWVLGKQSLLQMYNYANKLGLEKVGRDTYRGHKPLIRLQNFVKNGTRYDFILNILQWN